MNAKRRIISNTGPLISLEKLTNGYEFIRRLYETIFVPPSVLFEIAHDQYASPTDYLAYYGITDLICVRAVTVSRRWPELERLHDGEKEAILLGLELNLPLLIEETMGREIAGSCGIHVSGIAGQILKAYREGLISGKDAEEKLTQLYSAGRIGRNMHAGLLADIHADSGGRK